jgi:nitrous oxidase accessory protein
MDHSSMDHSEHESMPDGSTLMPISHLQATVDRAAPGDTVVVPDAVFQGNLVVRNSVDLVGSGSSVLDGAGRGSVLTLLAPDVTVRDLKIRNTALGPLGEPSGIMMEGAHRAMIEDVEISDVYIGITVRASHDVKIHDVRITGREGAVAGELHAVDGEHHGAGAPVPATDAQLRGDGIWLWNALRPEIRSNTIERSRDGIYVSYGADAVIEGNRILEARYAVHDMYATNLTIRNNTFIRNLSGIVLMYGDPVLAQGNTIVESGSASTGFGVLVKDAGSVTLLRNVIAGNRVGIHIDDAGRTGGRPTLVVGNTIAVNRIGVQLMPSADSTFTGNAFVENITQVSLGGSGFTQAVWTANGAGNHWSDYTGFDSDGDGVGDLAYAQGGRVSRMLADDPMLLAVASGPAFRLLSSVEERWAPEDPVVSDAAPVLAVETPRLRGDAAGSAPLVPLWMPGLVVALGCIWVIVGMRRSGRRGGEETSHE